MLRERFNDEEGEGGDGLSERHQPAQDKVRAIPVHGDLQFAAQFAQPLHRRYRPGVHQVRRIVPRPRPGQAAAASAPVAPPAYLPHPLPVPDRSDTHAPSGCVAANPHTPIRPARPLHAALGHRPATPACAAPGLPRRILPPPPPRDAGGSPAAAVVSNGV